MTDSVLTGLSWHTEDVDTGAYLRRIGVERARPDVDLLERLHAAHVRTFPFSNVEVLLGAHPGVDPATVHRQLVERGRGGYCFEHAQLFAAALEDLGYAVTRHLGRVHHPGNTRTHLSVVVHLDTGDVLTDPGFGLSVTGPIPLRDGATRTDHGSTFALALREDAGTREWELLRDGEPQHRVDELPARPADVRTGHWITSTEPLSIFLRSLMVMRRTDEGHVTVTHEARTVRHDDGTTERDESLTPAQTVEAVQELGVRLTGDEPARLAQVVERLRRAG